MVAQRPTMSDAREYLRIVENKFQDKPEKFRTLLKLLHDFKSRRIGTKDVITIVKDLFKGQRELILGFNTFLPKEYEIKLEDVKAPSPITVGFSDAISFINKVRIRFEDDVAVYRTFITMLNMFQKGRMSLSEVYNEVNLLFQEHNDLCLEFYNFLP
ncbi:unnamed protein product [Arabidopsis halleri]